MTMGTICLEYARYSQALEPEMFHRSLHGRIREIDGMAEMVRPSTRRAWAVRTVTCCNSPAASPSRMCPARLGLI